MPRFEVGERVSQSGGFSGLPATGVVSVVLGGDSVDEDEVYYEVVFDNISSSYPFIFSASELFGIEVKS
ncbi:hypothetical protein ACOA8Y_000093 [Serratia marcescens]